ncbi:MAG: peroxiredoxin family protein [bacterium]
MTTRLNRVWGALAAAVGLALTLPHAEGATHDGPWQALAVERPRSPLDAPPFTLSDLGGRLVSLADFRGRVVLLYFWTTW